MGEDDVAAYHANSCEHCANGTEHPQMDPDPRNFQHFDPNKQETWMMSRSRSSLTVGQIPNLTNYFGSDLASFTATT